MQGSWRGIHDARGAARAAGNREIEMRWLASHRSLGRVQFVLRLLEFQKTSKSGARIDIAGHGPSHEFRHVNAPVPGLAIENPTLRLPQALAQVTLGEPRLLS